MQICHFYPKGTCKNGALCRFVHYQTPPVKPTVYLDKDYDKDKEYELIIKNPNLIKSATYAARSSKKLICIILKINGLLLEYVSYDLKHDPEVIKIATDQNIEAYKYNGYMYYNHYSYKYNGYMHYNHYSYEYTKDIPPYFIELTKHVLSKDCMLLEYVPSKLQTNKKFILEILKMRNCLSYVNIHLLSDP